MKTRIGLLVVYVGLFIVNCIPLIFLPSHHIGPWWLLLGFRLLNGAAIGYCLAMVWKVIEGGRLWALLDLKGKLDIILGRLPWLNRSQRLIRFRYRFLSPNPFRLGYRFWDIAIWLPTKSIPTISDWVGGRFVLQAISSLSSWSPGPNIAECRNAEGMHSAPAEDCSCGFWSRGSILGIKFYRRSSRIKGMPTVIGAVVCWGKVIHHSLGLRAEKAMVIALLAEPNRYKKKGFTGALYDDAIQHLAAYYDVPVLRSSRELKRYATQYLRNEREAQRRNAKD